MEKKEKKGKKGKKGKKKTKGKQNKFLMRYNEIFCNSLFKKKLKS